MRNKLCYQTIGKAISAGFNTQNFQACFQAVSAKGGKGFALSKYSPVTFHYSPATAILNETRVQMPCKRKKNEARKIKEKGSRVKVKAQTFAFCTWPNFGS